MQRIYPIDQQAPETDFILSYFITYHGNDGSMCGVSELF